MPRHNQSARLGQSRAQQTSSAAFLETVHDTLYRHYGDLYWWPAETPFEVVVGAILTQNTAWTNVATALANLKQAGVTTAAQIAALPLTRLQQLIKPSGFFRQKADRLQAFSRQLIRHSNGDIVAFCQGPLAEIRNQLLAQPGIGPETADSILLYAAQRPIFVVDAYTRRIFQRLGVLEGRETYDQVQQFFMAHLPQRTALYKAYHAEIVVHAKHFCRKRRPFCQQCPLNDLCLLGQDTLRLT
ncbi:MAG: endonuclease III domain-containing protein [Desulfuromonadales bacterium]|jgi:endonuclease-3 related protein